MGLGLIALGFVLLEGMTIGYNSMKLFPQYISLTILLIGIFVVKKRIKIKYFDYALILGIIQFIYHFVVPQFENTFLFVDSILLIIDICIRLTFYAMLFKGVNKIVDNKRTGLYMKVFWIIYALLSAYLLVYYLMTMSQYSYQSNVAVLNTIFNTILLASKTILCYVISYRLYKHNKDLADEYEDLSVEFVKKYPRSVYVFLMVLSIGLIIVLQKPVFYVLEDAAKRGVSWYGSIENEIIIEGHAYNEIFYIDHLESMRNAPRIWINESDYEKSEYCTIIEYVGDSETIVEDKTRIHKDFEIDPKKDYFWGAIEGYKYLRHENIYGFADDVYDMRHHISIKVVLYDKNMNEVDEYNVPLIDRQPRLTEYHYQDSDVKIEGLMVDGDFIIQMPRITFHNENLKDYQIYISNHSTFGEYSINSINNQVIQDEIKERFGEYYYEEENAHLYLKAKQDYYIHIAYFENDTPHIVKTVRLEK